MKDVKVYAQNLRSYNMGLDQGRWITLGIEEQESEPIHVKNAIRPEQRRSQC